MQRWSSFFLVACVSLGAVSAFQSFNETGDDSASRARGTTCPCGLSNKGRIVGGTKAGPSEYPWIVMLVQTRGLQHMCGASIVTKKVAITAAHCTNGMSRVPMSIIAGTSDIRKPGQIVPVALFLQHEKYTAPYDASRTINDISLLLLARDLVFNPNVGPVCMPSSHIDLENKWVKIIGWGKLGGNLPSSKDLMEVDIVAKPFSVCQRSFPFQLPQTQFCVQSPGRGGCMGDSGGPLVVLDPETNRYTLVGLVSFGSGNCDPVVPTAATEVSAFLPWIRSKLSGIGCTKV